VRPDKVGNLFLEKVRTISEMEQWADVNEGVRGGGEEDVPWMARVADLIEGINQGALLVRLECDVEIDRGSRGWVAQTLPVDRNGMPGVLDLNVIPRYEGRREVGEGFCGEKEECREPEVSHEYRRSVTNVRFRRLKVLRALSQGLKLKYRKAELMMCISPPEPMSEQTLRLMTGLRIE
jgi:hypothetical protein